VSPRSAFSRRPGKPGSIRRRHADFIFLVAMGSCEARLSMCAASGGKTLLPALLANDVYQTSIRWTFACRHSIKAGFVLR
jgi:hypothetical protein